VAGQGTISVNQTKQYGDGKALDALQSGMTETPMTGNPTPAPTAGRPVSSGGGVSQTGNTEQPVNVPVGHQETAADVAAKAWAAKKWAEMAQLPTAGPRVRLYAQAAQKALEAAMLAARNQTPYFE
jgi:hypothetical protein